MCGKYLKECHSSSFTSGSPPRVREILLALTTSKKRIGITPAGAGNTCTTNSYVSCSRDHPRVCGKYYPKLPTGISKYGITPACAGNTSRLFRTMCVVGDHPRVCGKYLQLWHCLRRTRGSPPRVREILSRKYV